MKTLMISLAASAALLMGSVSLNANAAELRANHPDTYIVKKGDTLWDISGHFLEKPWKWPEIWHANPEIENPHLIFPGDILRLVYIDGKPYLTKSDRLPNGTIKLRPQARVLSEGDAITTIPLSVIRPYLIDENVLDASDFETAAYVVALQEDHALAGSVDDRMYIRGLGDIDTGASFGVYRKGKTYTDPMTNEVLGVEARFLASGSIERSGDPSTLRIRKAKLEVLKGDVVLPRNEEPLPPLFAPRAPVNEVSAQLLSVYDGVTQIGQYNVVTLSKGARDGIETGHVLSVYQRGKQVKDTVATAREGEDVFVTLPEERAGTLIVFRVFDKVSLGLIVDATRPMHLGDIAKNPY